MKYYHVNVFSSRPMSGNGLTIVFPERQISDYTLLEITREFKQFETIFIFRENEMGAFPVRIFTLGEELTFAGHPIIGAGAIIHHLKFSQHNTSQIKFDLSGRILNVESIYSQGLFNVTMNQGAPQFIKKVEKSYYCEIAKALGIRKSDIDAEFPIEVVSTGLPYLLVPVQDNLEKTSIRLEDFEGFLSRFGAKFVYVFDPKTLECRTWDNFGSVEDVATGSAAGPLCAYLVNNGFRKINEIIQIHQGKFVERPSIIQAWVTQVSTSQEVFIRGNVAFFASGELEI